MLDPSVLTDLEELTLCSYCKQKYNDAEQCPKYLSCKHYFCLRCIENNFLKGRELFCAHCWKRTDLGDQGPDALPTHSSLLVLTNNLSHLKITTNNTSGKTNDKERKSENCHTHGMPLALWCATCCTALCRACATPQEHPGHQIKSQTDAKEQLISDVQLELVAMGKLSTEIQRLAMQQREFLIKVLEACVTLKTHVETDLQNGWSHFPEITDARETLGKAKASLQMIDSPSDVYSLHSQLIIEKQRLQSKYQEMMLQCQLDDLIGNSGVVFDFALLKQALAGIHTGEPIVSQGTSNGGRLPNHLAASQNPILFLANYCMSQLYSRHVVSKQHLQNGSIEYHSSMMQPQPPPPGSVHVHQGPPPPGTPQQLLIPPGSPSVKPVPPAPPNAMLHPQQQSTFIPEGVGTGGGSLVTVHSSSQPPSTGIAASLRGPSNPYPLYYFNIEVNGSPHGRIVIECWEGESVITGDFELNNGRGGRSIFEDGYFMPDDTKFPAVRGAVGMRRTQKRHDNLGMVGSQFRIILQEMRGFTGIFGHVVEGLELVEKISTFGDQTGKPTKNILITKCGKL
ncbi:Peptidyl-prolyl cis-trans isomerase F, mitochondrial [Anthophora quadrimaculata]